MDYGRISEFTPSADSAFFAGAERCSWTGAELKTLRIDGGRALVICKPFQGLSSDWVDQTRQVLRAAIAGEFGTLKFIVFELDAELDLGDQRAPAANLLLGEIANLILRTPIITVAHASKAITGGDLELALACSMLICDEDVRVSFGADPIESVTTYALLAQKLGFVRAERLMESEEALTAPEMRDLFLLKEILPAAAGLDGVEAFLTRASRRHNSAAAMYRAQRIATPLISEFFGEQPN